MERVIIRNLLPVSIFMETGTIEIKVEEENIKAVLLSFSFDNPQSENPEQYVKKIEPMIELTIELPTPATKVAFCLDKLANHVNLASYEDEEYGILQFSSLKQGNN